MRIHKNEGTGLDTNFIGEVPDTITYHAACHLRAQNIGFKSRDLMKLTGARVNVVSQRSGIAGTWGLRAENYELAKGVGAKLGEQLEAAGGDVITGDCALANGAIFEEIGRKPMHPIQVIERAYGFAPERT